MVLALLVALFSLALLYIALHRYGWYDPYARAWVFNKTTRWFSIGATTSPENGLWCGFGIFKEVAKRQDEGEEHVVAFRGVMMQAAFWWLKVYVYLYFDGDGLE